MLYSSGIYCENTPEHDDLFGFSVKHVQDEARRGYKLKCDDCKKSGATVGCEVKRCTKSFHFPCAIGAGAETVEDEEGRYAVYCKKHRSQNEGGANGVSSADSSDSSTRHSSKVSRRHHERNRGTSHLDNSRNDIATENHETPRHKPFNGDSIPGPSTSSDSRRPLKRGLSYNYNERSERPPKMFAPISDLDSEDDEDSSQTNQRPGDLSQQLNRNDMETATASVSDPATNGAGSEEEDDGTLVDSKRIGSVAEPMRFVVPVMLCNCSETTGTITQLFSYGYRESTLTLATCNKIYVFMK
uniref:PHD-type domain-containing protein n=1 Tax=Gadus morhua TaxID=8049 RepID=A0A8C4ZP99_GADMO